MPRTFVAGSTGFIGRELTARLVAMQHSVVCLVRPGRDTRDLECLGIEIVRGDVADPSAIDHAMQGCELALNFTVSRNRHAGGFAQNRQTNVVGAGNIARAAARAGVAHLIHVGSCGVYGLEYPGHPFTEDSPLKGDTNYRATKAEGERIVRQEAEKGGLPVTIARLSTVYGPGSAKGWDNFARAILLRGRLTAIGDGRHYHHLTHVDDVVDALLHLLARTPEGGFRCYNVGADPIPTLREIFDAIARALGVTYRFRGLPAFPFRLFRRASTPVLTALKRESGLNQMIKFFTVPRAYDTRRLLEETGFRPRIGIEEGMARFVNWLRETGQLEETRLDFLGDAGGE